MNDWRNRASCLPYDPELWFPVGYDSPAGRLQVARAKTICKRCPVRSECLNYASRTRQEAGIWGGLTEEERRRQRPRANGRVPA